MRWLILLRALSKIEVRLRRRGASRPHPEGSHARCKTRWSSMAFYRAKPYHVHVGEKLVLRVRAAYHVPLAQTTSSLGHVGQRHRLPPVSVMCRITCTSLPRVVLGEGNKSGVFQIMSCWRGAKTAACSLGVTGSSYHVEWI